MQVPLLDLKQQHDALRAELRAATERVLDSQQFVLGEEVRLLEADIARYCGVRHAIGCASGSDALLLALMALDIRAGDEVITTPFSFFATASAITRTNATPVFVDIEPRTYNLDPSLVEAAITERTRAIMPVHLYGQCAEMDALMEIAARHKLPVIEDAAQAIGAEDNTRRRAGSIGRVGCFSFYPTKNLGAAGDAGILTTDDDALAERLCRLRVHGGATEYLHQEIGINSRLDALQAAILRVKLPHLDGWSDARRERAETYSQLLTNARLPFTLHVPVIRENTRHIFHQYVVSVPEHRDALIEHLRAHGVGTKIYYPVPLHLQECFAYLGYTAGALPVAERAARETLALPLYPELRLEQQQYVVEVISRFRP